MTSISANSRVPFPHWDAFQEMASDRASVSTYHARKTVGFHAASGALSFGRSTTGYAALSLALIGGLTAAFVPRIAAYPERQFHRGSAYREARSTADHFPEAAVAPADEVAVLGADTTRSCIDRIIRNLAAMENGWAGSDSLAPTTAVLRDMDAALASLDHIKAAPNAEIDDSDGSVALVWDNDGASFSLTFNGKGRVVGVVSPRQSDYSAWSIEVENDARLAKKLEEKALARFLEA